MDVNEEKRKIREEVYRDRLRIISKKIWNLQNDVADAFESRNRADYISGVGVYYKVNELLTEAAKLCESAA